MENVRNGHICIQLMKQNMTKNEHRTRYLQKTGFPQSHTSNFCILVPEGFRELNDTAKCSQWPHLNTTYKATYGLNQTYNEIFAKIRLRKRCKFSRIFAELQWSITHNVYEELRSNFYTTFIFIR